MTADPAHIGAAALFTRQQLREWAGHWTEAPNAGPVPDEGMVVTVDVADAHEAVALLDALVVLRDAGAEHRASASQVLAALLPSGPTRVGRGTVLQAQRNAAAQLALAAEFGLLSSADVARLAGSTADNRSSLASRWRQRGAIFGLPVEGGIRYPGFQLDDAGRPLPAVAQVVQALGDLLSPWELALWFTGTNGWLGDRRPVDVLRDAPPVQAAAAHLAAELAA